MECPKCGGKTKKQGGMNVCMGLGKLGENCPLYLQDVGPAKQSSSTASALEKLKPKEE